MLFSICLFQIQPCFDVEVILNRSINSGSLVYTIPWVTEYLAVLDPIALRLSHYKNILHSLFEITILRAVNKNVYIVKVCIGWLLELPHFPREIYYDWLSQKVGSQDVENHLQYRVVNSKKSPDDWVVVDQSVLYVCCPYLEQIKTLLSTNNRNSNSSGLCVKHITPTTAVGSWEETANRKLQVSRN